jgi:hypothetical protein
LLIACRLHGYQISSFSGDVTITDPSPRMMAALTGDRKSVLEGTWALGAIAIVVVLLRILAKARLRHLGTDDVTMIASLVSSCQ